MTKLKHTAVESSNLASYAYSPITKTLELKFNDGKLYQYLDVPEHIWSEFQNADSKGKYANTHIFNTYNCILQDE